MGLSLERRSAIMSTHIVKVVPVNLEPHPNADLLSLVKVGGWTCVVRTEDWVGKDRGVYIPPDYVVPQTEQFEFLGEDDKKRRVRVRRFRGILSQGLLMPAPDGSEFGDDFMDAWGIIRYEPPVACSTGGQFESGPTNRYIPHYDVENFQAYPDVLTHGETVVATEKLHGTNSRYIFCDGRMFCGSRKHWMQESNKCLWWHALRDNPEIEEWCRANENLVLWGEVFGRVQSLVYGAPSNRFYFASFDIWDPEQGRFLDVDDAASRQFPLWAPQVYRGPFDADLLLQKAEGDTAWPGASHMAEGIVVKPLVERTHPEVGRVQLKMVSNRYLEKGR
jgi:RNA ligase (TIGR02306 family)